MKQLRVCSDLPANGQHLGRANIPLKSGSRRQKSRVSEGVEAQSRVYPAESLHSSAVPGELFAVLRRQAAPTRCGQSRTVDFRLQIRPAQDVEAFMCDPPQVPGPQGLHCAALPVAIAAGSEHERFAVGGRQRFTRQLEDRLRLRTVPRATPARLLW